MSIASEILRKLGEASAAARIIHGGEYNAVFKGAVKELNGAAIALMRSDRGSAQTTAGWMRDLARGKAKNVVSDTQDIIDDDPGSPLAKAAGVFNKVALELSKL